MKWSWNPIELLAGAVSEGIEGGSKVVSTGIEMGANHVSNKVEGGASLISNTIESVLSGENRFTAKDVKTAISLAADLEDADTDGDSDSDCKR